MRKDLKIATTLLWHDCKILTDVPKYRLILLLIFFFFTPKNYTGGRGGGVLLNFLYVTRKGNGRWVGLRHFFKRYTLGEGDVGVGEVRENFTRYTLGGVVVVVEVSNFIIYMA